jgi:hypothetical protein
MNARHPEGLPTLPMLPWWRVKMVWLVIGGPLAVVVASFVTLGLAITHPDPIVTQAAPADAAHVPAVAARNHAAAPKPN